MKKREGSEVEEDKRGIKNRWEGHYDYHCGVRKGQGAEKGTLPVPQALVHVLNKDKKLNVERHTTYNTQQLVWTFNNVSLMCYIFIMHFTLGEELYWSMISSILGCLCQCIPCFSVCVSWWPTTHHFLVLCTSEVTGRQDLGAAILHWYL